jgi:hypothetical protein
MPHWRKTKHLELTVKGSTFRYGNSADWKMKYRPATRVFSLFHLKHVSIAGFSL